MNTPSRIRFTPRRELGRTGFVATPLGIGDLADRALPLETCVATAQRALATGLNLIDTAPGYEDGYSEQIVGQAIQAVPRDQVFVITKIDHADQPIEPQVDGSLSRLKLERVDLLVLHGCSSEDWLQQALSAKGHFDQMDHEIARGRARFKGISSHNPEVLWRALSSRRCDVVMFPVGPYVDERYVEEVLPLAKHLRVGTVCFKTFGAGKLLGDTQGYNRPLSQRPRGKVSSGGSDAAVATLPRLSVEDCLHYTLTADPDVALLGMSFPNEQDAAFAAYESFTPLSPQRVSEIRRQAVAAIRDKGPCWWNPSGK